MNDHVLHRDLRDLFAAGPRSASAGTVDNALAAARLERQRRPRFARLDPRAWPPRRRSVADPALRRSARLVVAAGLAVLLMAAVIAVGARLLERQRVELTQAGALHSRISVPIALALADGRILIHGQGSAAIFDPATGTSVSASLAPFENPRVLALPDGRFAVLGSTSAETRPTEFGILDPMTRKTTLAGELPLDTFGEVAVVLEDGRLLITGGADSSPESFVHLATAYVFDPATGATSELAPMLAPRVGHVMLVLDDGRVLIVGGVPPASGGNPLDVELYDPVTGRSEAIGSVHRSEFFWPGPSLELADGRVLIAGATVVDEECGDPADPRLQHLVVHQEMFVFDPSTRSLERAADVPHGLNTAVALLDGRALVIGSSLSFPDGCKSTVPPVAQPWLGVYDPRIGMTYETQGPSSGASTPSVDLAHDYAAGVLLPDGRVVLIADDSGGTANTAVDFLSVNR